MRRSLTRDEAELWARVAGTVKPLQGNASPPSPVGDRPGTKPLSFQKVRGRPVAIAAAPPLGGKRGADLRDRPQTLDGTWDRKLVRGLVPPDFTIDLHGHTLNSAHDRLDSGLAMALAVDARLVLLITGRPRPSEDHGFAGHGGRSERRGAIRAKFLDWLANGSHAGRIAAVRPAHPRHGGHGAVYIVMRRR